MKCCHRPSIKMLDEFLNGLNKLDYTRALEVAAGGG